jgi:hypothetical protein
VLDRAELDGAAAGPVPELAALWFHRGNVFYQQRDVASCRAAHQRALDIAIAGGWSGEQARAWGGLGDVIYSEGTMAAARSAFQHCADLALEAGLVDVRAANLPMVGLTSFFLGDLDSSERASAEALAVMTGGAHRGALGAGMTIALCAHLKCEPARAEVEAAVRRSQPSPIAIGFGAFALSLVARSEEEARRDAERGLAAMIEGRGLGIRGALLARLAAMTRDAEALASSIRSFDDRSPVNVRLLGLPHALQAARRLHDDALGEDVLRRLERLGEGAPWAARVARWGRGGPDPQLDAAFPS